MDLTAIYSLLEQLHHDIEEAVIRSRGGTPEGAPGENRRAIKAVGHGTRALHPRALATRGLRP
jgi:hypothetical protein